MIEIRVVFDRVEIVRKVEDKEIIVAEMPQELFIRLTEKIPSAVSEIEKQRGTSKL